MHTLPGPTADKPECQKVSDEQKYGQSWSQEFHWPYSFVSNQRIEENAFFLECISLRSNRLLYCRLDRYPPSRSLQEAHQCQWWIKPLIPTFTAPTFWTHTRSLEKYTSIHRTPVFCVRSATETSNWLHAIRSSFWWFEAGHTQVTSYVCLSHSLSLSAELTLCLTYRALQ